MLVNSPINIIIIQGIMGFLNMYKRIINFIMMPKIELDLINVYLNFSKPILQIRK